MNRNNDILVRRVRKGRRGQVLPILAMSTVVFFGIDALVVDFGIIFIHQNELKASTQAAALAGAQNMGQAGATAATVTTAATYYSAATGGSNAYANLPNVSIVAGYPKLSCLTTLKNVLGIQCIGPSNANAIVVKQQETVPLLLARLLGSNSITLTATATASMRGASAGPFNVAIVVDSTASMNSTDSASNCNSTRLKCAMAGVRVLLQNLSPCLSSQVTCGAITNGNVINSVDRVSLLTFPPVTTATVAHDYDCGNTAPTTAGYWTAFPATSTYQIVNFSSDYRTSDIAGSLYATSNIVKAAGGKAGPSPCLQAIGGFGTFYAQAIYQAQTYLVNEKTLFPNSQNVIILLSDGDATATCTTSSGGVCTAGDLKGASTTGTTYIATKQECHQAIKAAQDAAAAGTRVYSVAYGATASGCSSDTSPTITPCQTMEQIASSPGYFFSDYTATGGSSSCISAAQPASSLNQIFQVIAGDLTFAKLIPDDTQ